MAEKRDALKDPEFRDFYMEYDAAFDWSPDDPRLYSLAERTERWLAKRSQKLERGQRSVPDPAIVQLLARSGAGSSPAWDRLRQISFSMKSRTRV